MLKEAIFMTLKLDNVTALTVNKELEDTVTFKQNLAAEDILY